MVPVSPPSLSVSPKDAVVGHVQPAATLWWAEVGDHWIEATVWVQGKKRWEESGESHFFTTEHMDQIAKMVRDHFGAVEVTARPERNPNR